VINTSININCNPALDRELPLLRAAHIQSAGELSPRWMVGDLCRPHGRLQAKSPDLMRK
jgi:hypothetical protein